MAELLGRGYASGVLTQLSIQRYRGIQDGLFTELGPINIVVGPNNCGKSTFLEALSLFKTPDFHIDPLGRAPHDVVAERRNELQQDKRGDLRWQQTPLTWWFRLDRSKEILFEAK